MQDFVTCSCSGLIIYDLTLHPAFTTYNTLFLIEKLTNSVIHEI